jgi:hypothetical protein
MEAHLFQQMPQNSCRSPFLLNGGLVRPGQKRSDPFEADGHGVQGERAEQVAAHALLHLDEGAGGSIDPVHGQALGQALQIGGQIEVADEAGVPATTSSRSSIRLPSARSRLMVFSWPSAPAR